MTSSEWDAAIEVLRTATDVTLACHVNPDGDALGSLLGLSRALANRGARTYPTWGTTPLPDVSNFGFLPGLDTLVQPGEVPVTPVFIALDCGAADRLGDIEPLARKAEVLVNIDHHPGNEGFGTINVVHPDASSTAELVMRLLRDAGLEIDQVMATLLYTGIVTDTGRFSYVNTSPNTLRLAADLLETGVSAPDLARELFESAPFGYLKLVGRVLDRAELAADERFVHSWITQQDLKDTDVALAETDRLVDLIRGTAAVDVAALFKEQMDGRWRVSLRSKTRGIADFARARGGGGHELAAGFTARDRDSTVEELKAALRNPSA
ncbi:MAG TPA: bifunctional oligoribonuclease/PAP phosphatase NrnA [Actinomycetota bacterium]|nr:bifunctional oligoribonuclease/PAP phosphatase NrnA [Actinomycetota bacterium]